MADPTRAKIIVPPTRDPLRPNVLPSTQGLIRPRFSGRPLTPFEVDYSEMEILGHSREVGPDGNVKYFLFKLRLSEPDSEPQEFYKAVRLIRLTRVPRYLRQAGKDPSAVFDQQRDVLAALREQDVLFLNLIAKAPEIPMVFSYGVQAVGNTLEEAKAMADRAYAVLSGQLDGTYQQLEYQPLSPDEAEHLVRYQTEWSHIAAARGTPVASGSALSLGGGVLDGNRTDVESAANQLEAFLRGMDDHSFMVTTIMAPVSPAEITRTWRNLTARLSDIRSDTDGARSVTAGIAVPLGMGMGLGENHGQSHSVAEAHSVGEAFTESQSVSASESVTDTASHTQGASTAETIGTSQSVTDTVATSEGVTDTLAVAHSTSEGVSASVGTSEGVSHSEALSQGESLSASVSESQSLSQGEALSQSMTQSHQVGVGHNVTEGQSISEQMGSTVGQSSSVGVSQSQSQSASASLSDSHSINQGASSSLSESLGANWSQSFQEAISAQQSRAENWQQNFQETLASQFGLSDSNSSSWSKGESIAKGSSISVPIAGKNETLSDVWNRMFGDSNDVSSSVSNSSSKGSSVGGSNTNSVGSSLTTGASTGGSSSQTTTQGVSVGETRGQTATQSIGQTATQGVTQTEAISQAQSHSVGMGRSLSQSQSLSQAEGLSRGVGLSESITTTEGSTQGVGFAESITATEGMARSAQASQAQGVSQSVSQSGSQAQALSRGISQAQSLSQGTSQASTVSQSVASSVGRSVGSTQGASAGVSQTASAGRGLTDSYLLSMGRSAQHSSSLGLVPSVGIAISRQTHDVQKKRLGDILDAQVRRLDEARIGGAYMYQMYIQAANSETLHRAAGLLKAAFWGSEDPSRQWHAFHVVNPEALEEDRQRIHDHIRAFSHYRRREPNAEFIEPFKYSTLITPREAAQFTHPPVTEASGLLAVHDSMPVFARPFDRQDRDIDLGYVINGERGKPSDVHFGLDPDELEHTLLAGATGSGKSTTLLKMLAEVTQVSRTITLPRDPNNPLAPPQQKVIYAGALCLDWQTSLRSLAQIVPAERFRFYSIADPSLGHFRWNPLAIPSANISPAEWVDTLADQFMIAYGLGEYGRSIIQEHIEELYRANRLEPYPLKEPVFDESGRIVAHGIRLDPVDRDALPEDAIDIAPDGTEIANVYTCPDLSRLISMADLAVLIRAKMEELATTEAGRLYGTEIRNRYQTIWRRLQYFAPGGAGARTFDKDPSLDEIRCLTVPDIVNPDKGLFTVIEVDGLDRMHRKFILGSVLLAVWRYGQSHGKGVFNHNGAGPGTFVCMEEAHELFGSQEDGEDNATAERRTAIYESLFRRARALGLKLIAVVQNPADIPTAIHSNTSTAIIHRLSDERDRRVVAGLMNWNIQFDHRREVRYLGEMPKGWCLVRLEPKDHFLQAAPVHVQVDPPALRELSADDLRQLLNRR